MESAADEAPNPNLPAMADRSGASIRRVRVPDRNSAREREEKTSEAIKRGKWKKREERK